MPKLILPAALRRHLPETVSEMDVEGPTVADALDELMLAHPQLRPVLFEGSELKNTVRVFVNEEDIRSLHGTGTPIQGNDEVLLLPPIAGG
ncbi:MAG: MoaD/ThiS family protein [Verrucomicrobia bacterium]|nr:MoaD/ThiS family protein [Verrucomicrobiota bacterium]MCH8510822.1 MoaD/ThiS family protein [Kiritimatiellia bacterium]